MRIACALPYCSHSFVIQYSPGDVSAMTPGGIRMGTPALTSRYVSLSLSICFAVSSICSSKGNLQLPELAAHLQVSLYYNSLYLSCFTEV